MRPLCAEINLSHLRHNYQFLKKCHGNKLLAVLKANAYGHGAVECAKALADLADGFAVCCVEEALALRKAGLRNPIVLLEGVFDSDEYALVEEYNLWPVIHSTDQLTSFLNYKWEKSVTVWLKMDSGMGRVGFLPQDYAEVYRKLKISPYVKDIVKVTHFSRADEPQCAATTEQIKVFDAVARTLKGEESMANSAAILAFPDACRDWGRAGLALYGINPLAESDSGDLDLKPVMTLKTKVFSVRQLKVDSPIGYGATFVTDKDTLTGVIACGYADGYPRLASTGAPVLVDNKLTRIIGRVSMDMIVVDLTNFPEVTTGSQVELWGNKVAINDIAKMAGTIPYELLCNVKRAKFVYVV